jgi:diaminopimelate epimerase
MKVKFVKMTGAGNDFVVIDNRSSRIKNGPKTARMLCDRRWGIGADGLLLLQKSRRADYKMIYYNADGSYGGMCGNGGRCIASYASAHRIASRKHVFEALKYLYHVEVNSGNIILSMKDPRSLSIGDTFTLDRQIQPFSFVDTGAPHAVIVLDDLRHRPSTLDAVDLGILGPRIRHHPRFRPGGTNVNIVQRSGPRSLRIRTYERGVEAETLACGTGAIAAAIVGSRIWGAKPPVSVVPRSGIGLRIDFSEHAGRISNVRLTGPAKVVFEGEITI